MPSAAEAAWHGLLRISSVPTDRALRFGAFHAQEAKTTVIPTELLPRTIQLFDDLKVTEVLPARRSRFGHYFGGPIAHEGLAEDECGFPVHLLCSLHTEDPLVGTAIPGAKWLPLYYCFSFENASMRMGYRVLSDDRIQPFFDGKRRIRMDSDRFPGEEFPQEFPRTPLVTRAVPFDPSNLEHVARYVNAFGISSLPLKDQRAFLQECKRWWDESAPDPWTRPLEELLQQCPGPACQGPPNSACANPECVNHSKEGHLGLFALVPAVPVSNVLLWGNEYEDVQILFEICPLCSTIVVTNQCT